MPAASEQFRAHSHFVPCLSLKHFENAADKLWVYRTLVSHPTVPVWDEKSTRSVAAIRHLYTRIVGGKESDEMERWLDREFEEPASEAIQRVVSDDRLHPRHWDALIRFVAAQTVRTPAFLLRCYPEWHKSIPEILNSVAGDLARRLELSNQFGRPIEPLPRHPFAEYVPSRVTTEQMQDQRTATVKVETIVGRGLWHFQMRHLLTSTVRVLENHRWSIVKPFGGLRWFTTDDPVLALNYGADGSYDFGGGWGRRGTEIFLPLSPLHLLYTSVGQKPLRRGTTLDRSTTQMLRGFLAEHAHQAIFAAAPDDEIPKLHPRIVNETRFREEEERWQTFPIEQAKAEMSWATKTVGCGP